MKKTRYFLLLTMLLVIVYSCNRPSNVLISTEKWVKQEKGRYKCELTNQYSTEQRRNMYPFNKAATVLFIAYINNQIHVAEPMTVIDTIYTLDGKQIISEKEVFVAQDFCKVQKIIQEWQLITEDGEKRKYCAIESIKLNQMDMDTLSNILLNYKVSIKGGPIYPAMYGCYFPRNAIIFLDETENPIGFIEICFECNKTFCSNKMLKEVGDIRLCLEKLTKIENLFTTVGIHYGIGNEKY